MTEDPLTDCPACQAPKLVKQIQAAGFALKGTGWYVTDFRDKGKKPASSEDSGSKTAPEKTESATDAKPDAKADAKTETKPEPAKATGTSD